MAEIARLIASLELKDRLTPATKKAMGSVDKLDARLGRLGKTASRGISTAAGNIAKLGLAAGAVLGSQVVFGIRSLADLETATTKVTGAIEAMGLSGKVSAEQIATWANEIEAATDAAFDDKAITAATETLIRYGKIAPENIQRAMVVMADLAVRTGDVDSASTKLGKALAAPAKATRLLRDLGITLTAAEEKQIKAFVKAGKTLQAQDFILDRVAKTTAGAAKNSVGPMGDMLNELADATEDAQRALAIGFLPVITKVGDMLQKGLADKGNINRIRSFGVGLADAFEDLLEAAKKIPWTSIADAMKLAGTGAKAALDFFLKLPPWVQTAVLTGWGLNKLTGGALSSIVGQLASGLVKGVLGITAGVVRLTAGTVIGTGTGTGVPTPGGGGGGGTANTLRGFLRDLGRAIPLFGIPLATAGESDDAIRDIQKDVFGISTKIDDLHTVIEEGDRNSAGGIFELLSVAEKSGHAGYITAQSARATAVYGKRAYEEQRRGEQQEGERSRVQMQHLAQIKRVGEDTKSNILTAADRQIVVANQAKEVLRSKDFSPTVVVPFQVTLRDFNRTIDVSGRFGRKVPV